MREYNYSATDLKTLIGQKTYHGYQQQERSKEAAQANEYEPLICYFCKSEIRPDQSVNLHHPTYKSNGGTHVEPAHETCHVEYHSKKGDFQRWGKKAAAKKRWAFHLLNVRTHPAYEPARQFYLTNYANAG